jgi:hypothetical protein
MLDFMVIFENLQMDSAKIKEIIDKTIKILLPNFLGK